MAHLGTLPCALAVDGKWIRDRALSLCLSDHETGAPLAMGFAKEKPKNNGQTQDDYKREGEQTIPLRLYATTNLENATITGAWVLFGRSTIERWYYKASVPRSAPSMRSNARSAPIMDSTLA